MKKLVYFGISVFLTGCFFDNKAEDTSKKPQLEQFPVGVLIMQDVHGPKSGADLEAAFWIQSVEKPAKISRQYRGFLGATDAAESNVCKISRRPQPTEKPAEAQYLSAGNLSFGVANSQTMTPMKEYKNHFYQLPLTSGIGSNLFQIAGSGSKEIPKFIVPLSFPEDLTTMVVNNFDFSKDPVNVKKSENLKVTWNAALLEDERDYMELAILTDTEKEQIDLHCRFQEKLLLRNDKTMSWEISKEYLQELPLTTQPGKITVARTRTAIINTRLPVTQTIGTRVFQTIVGVGE